MSLVSAGLRLILSALSTSSGVDKADTEYPTQLSPVQVTLGQITTTPSTTYTPRMKHTKPHDYH